ncbi:MAG: guanine deaminase, partial [Rhodobacteraceae bacterium]|nr:guanine deaminase [Paracoccaceae bacterium]
MNNRKIVKGRVLSFSQNPFNHHFNFNSLNIDNKYIYVNNDQIEFIDDTLGLDPEYENAERIDHGDYVIMAGFVDAHVHYPQTAIIASWGKRLIDWLNTYTFPEEMRFGDAEYAAEIAGRYIEFALRNGTTS